MLRARSMASITTLVRNLVVNMSVISRAEELSEVVEVAETRIHHRLLGVEG